MLEKSNTDYFQKLLSRYKDGSCTPNEVRELFDFFKLHESDNAIEEDLRKEFDLIFNNASEVESAPAKVIRLHPFRKYAIAAAASIAIIFSFYFLFVTKKSDRDNNEPLANKDVIIPGHKQAVLTMDNGKTVLLDSSSVGKIADLSGTVVSLDKNGELLYDASNAKQEERIISNTVSTPTGGFFKIVLPDGSNVWLNSESELTFPSKFLGSERNVMLKGEGYFEVAKNKENPFRVHLAQGEEITVLGTVFNVMTYANEPSQKITLLEGSINLSKSGISKILKPGQQAIVSNEQIDIKNEAAIDHEIAWKNGLFDFQDDDLPAILRQISRWYNVDIAYNASNHVGHYVGSIRKSSGINEVLKMLELAGDVNFSIVGRKIIVNEKK
ncbi:MAG: FecR family protein [Ginsengibacter sp.]